MQYFPDDRKTTQWITRHQPYATRDDVTNKGLSTNCFTTSLKPSDIINLFCRRIGYGWDAHASLTDATIRIFVTISFAANKIDVGTEISYL